MLWLCHHIGRGSSWGFASKCASSASGYVRDAAGSLGCAAIADAMADIKEESSGEEEEEGDTDLM